VSIGRKQTAAKGNATKLTGRKSEERKMAKNGKQNRLMLIPLGVELRQGSKLNFVPPKG
jgi:invasion protein IalB